MSFIKELKIGNVHLKNNLVLGPMASVTDSVFRLLCSNEGVGLVVSEMVSAKALINNNKKCAELIGNRHGVRPYSVQLFGSDVMAVEEAVRILNDEDFDILDFNMGCPVPKVIRNGDGSYLMTDPFLVDKIVSTMVSTSNKPVTVKIRKGFSNDRINALQIAKIIEEAGASAIAIHGRTREEMYSGSADWDIIKSLKEELNIPLIGNGDIVDPISCKKFFEYTKADGAMIARAAKGRPWIFSDIINYDKNGSYDENIDKNELVDRIKKHLKLMYEDKGDHGVLEMRKHIAWYTAGYKGGSHLRNKINTTKNYEDIVNILTEFSDN